MFYFIPPDLFSNFLSRNQDFVQKIPPDFFFRPLNFSNFCQEIWNFLKKRLKPPDFFFDPHIFRIFVRKSEIFSQINDFFFDPYFVLDFCGRFGYRRLMSIFYVHSVSFTFTLPPLTQHALPTGQKSHAAELKFQI